MPEPRTVWLNGQLVDERAATVSIWDRGFLFGDGVYELVRFFRAEPASGQRRVGVGMDLHVARLHRSLGLARIRGFDAAELPIICERLLDAHGLDDAAVYLQVTRGAGTTRLHIPPADLRPTVFAYCMPCEPMEKFVEPAPIKAVLLEDMRWRWCQIKTISLMGNILAALDAHEHDAAEAILVRDGLVAEGASTNVLIARHGRMVTPPVDDDPPILHGVTRAELIEVADRAGLRAEVRPIAVEELAEADEIMVSSSRRLVHSVVQLDDRTIGGGVPGPVARQLFAAMRNRIIQQCRGSTAVLA